MGLPMMIALGILAGLLLVWLIAEIWKALKG